MEGYRNGVVSDGVTLNVFRYPWPESEIVGELTDSMEFAIDEYESVGMFYKICTAAGIEGFCLKKFVTITR